MASGLLTRRAALAGAASAAACGPALAQSFPSKLITFVVPLTAGGPADTTARVMAQKLSIMLGQQVIVENMGSAGGMLALNNVSRATPDGHTLLVGPGSFVTIAPMMAGAKIDPVALFEPVSLISGYPSALFVSTKLPVRTLDEFIAYARANSGKLNFSSPGAGTMPHLACEIIARRFGFQATHVPYRGGAPSLMAVVGGDVEFSSFEPSNLAIQLQTGKIRILAMGDSKRNPALPDVPTFAELGYPELVFTSWTAAFAPKGTPPQVIAKLNATFREALSSEDVKDQFKKLQIEPMQNSPEELRKLQISEIALRTPLIEDLGLIQK